MTRASKILIVVGGYAAATLIAFAVTHARMVATSGPEWQDSGMLAFGDTVLFVGAFGLAAIPATCAALFFLRPIRAFWQVSSISALVIAATAIAALLSFLTPTSARAGASPDTWSALAPLRILLAPLLATASLLCVVFAPPRSGRNLFLAAIVIEAGVFAWVAFIWWNPSR